MTVSYQEFFGGIPVCISNMYLNRIEGSPLRFRALSEDSVEFRVSTLTVCYYHVMCTFQSESILYSCLNVKEYYAQNRRNI